jgi:hypothetical protein
VNVFHKIYVERLFFIRYNGLSTIDGNSEGISALEKIFQENLSERDIFRVGERIS